MNIFYSKQLESWEMEQIYQNSFRDEIRRNGCEFLSRYEKEYISRRKSGENHEKAMAFVENLYSQQ